MPNIIINEIDETSAGESASSTDIVYIPGFADTNSSVYIFNSADKEPTTSLAGVVATSSSTYNDHTQYPQFAANVVTKKSWKCTAVSTVESTTTYTWTEMESYQAPYSENVPVLCETMSEFEDAFGSIPYKFEIGYDSTGTLETSIAFDARIAFPSFSSDAMPSTPFNAYSSGDYEKSYIYAKEIIALGIPVMFENIVERDSSNNNRKKLPSVSYLYQNLSTCYDNLADKGEYTVKYITSGAYPTFEYIGSSTFTGDFSDKGDYVYEGTSGSTSTVSTTNCSGTFHGVSIGGPKSVKISFTYNNGSHGEITVESGTTYTESGSHGWGGTGTTIEITSAGFTTTFASSAFTFDEGSATYVATATKTVTVSGTDIAQKMITTASDRGDAVAIIDHTNNPIRKLTGDTSVFGTVKLTNITDAEFGTMFTPWASYTTVREASAVPSLQIMPASFGYLLSLGKSLKTNANWMAVAGVTRGLVPYIQNLNTVDRLSNTIANLYQQRDEVSINPITNIKPYGLTIWGNRTLKDNAVNGNITATSILSIRNLVSDVKKLAYTTAKSLMFEQNTDVLWLNFKAGLTPLLDKMMSGQGISNYKIIKGTTTEKAKVVAQIKIYPTYPVEDFEISVIISDETVDVA